MRAGSPFVRITYVMIPNAYWRDDKYAVGRISPSRLASLTSPTTPMISCGFSLPRFRMNFRPIGLSPG